MAKGKVFLLGEQNPLSNDPRYALYPGPAGSAGARLAAIFGMTPREYLAAFIRKNLLRRGERWSLPLARDRATEILRDVGAEDVVVALGARVSAALHADFESFTRPQNYYNGWLVILPHPSGRSRLWNAPGSAERARELVLPLLKE